MPAPRRLKFTTEDPKMMLTRDQQVELLQNLVTTMVKAVAEIEEDVRVNTIVSEHNIVFEVRVASSDVGLVLGRDGNTTDAMRNVLYVACKKTNFKVHLDVVTGTRPRSDTRRS